MSTFSPAVLAQRAAALPVVSYPDLPVSEHRDEIATAIRDNQVVIVAGETGSGKTTQLPKICLELGRGIEGTIGHTQPRRLAARSVAERIATELDQKLGETIGYQVRFSEEVGPTTLVKLMTDGILLNEIQQDPLLKKYDTIIVDEAHERSLNIDFILGYLGRLLPQRPDLKLIITSATIDSDRFAQHFSDLLGQPVPVIEVSGRTYPVEIRYRPLVEDDRPPLDVPTGLVLEDPEGDFATFGYGLGEEIDLEQGVMHAVDELLLERNGGDILVFLPGERDIREMQRALEDKPVEVVPLYARLSAAEQQRVFQPHSQRRVILATNIAETSLTVPGVQYVIDTGLARVSRFSNKTKVQRLPIEGVSQASADQRSGRAGRLSDGIAIRLYSASDFTRRPEFTEPEILRTSLASVILQMSALGLGEVADFPFIDAPSSRAVRDGVQLLVEIGALTESAELTPVGRKLARLPIDPRLGRMLLAGDSNGCASEVLVIVAALSIQDVRERPLEAQAAADEAHARFENHDSDFLTYLNLWRYLNVQSRDLSGSAFRRLCRREYLHYLRFREWRDVVSQLRRMCRQLGIRVDKLGEPSRRELGNDVAASVVAFGTGVRAVDYDQVHRSLLVGLLSNVGNWDETKKNYVGTRGTRFNIWPGSGVGTVRWVMAAELVETSRLFARTAARIKPEWIEEVGQHLLVRNYSEPYWSRSKGAALIKERTMLYGLTLTADRAILLGHLGDRPIGAEKTVRTTVAQPGTIAAIAQGLLGENRGRLLLKLGTTNQAVTAAELAHEMFLREALVENRWRSNYLPFVKANQEKLEAAEEVAQRHRDPGLVWDEEERYQFFAERVPERLNNARSFEKWWKRQRETDPDLLTYPTLLHSTPEEGEYPQFWEQGTLRLPLSYDFRPGSTRNGVTVTIPLALLPQVVDEGFDWLVPGMREELCAGTIRALPKAQRRHLVPAPEVGAQIAARLDEPIPEEPPVTDRLEDSLNRLQQWAGASTRGSNARTKTAPTKTAPTKTPSAGHTPKGATSEPTRFFAAFAAAALAVRGVELDPKVEPELPPHLQMHFQVVDERGRTVAEGPSVTHLQKQLAKRADQAVSKAVSRAVSTAVKKTPKLVDLTEFPRADWDVKARAQVRGYPALTPTGTVSDPKVAVKVFANADEAARDHTLGVANLLLRELRLPTGRVTTRWSGREALLLASSPYRSTAELVDAAQLLAAQQLATDVRCRADFDELVTRSRDQFEERVYQNLLTGVQTLGAAAELQSALDEFSGDSLRAVRADAQRRLNRLVQPGFLGETHLPRYLRAQTQRLQRAARDAKALRADEDKTAQLRALNTQLDDLEKTIAAAPYRKETADGLRHLRFLWEELSVSFYAEQLGTAEKVSTQRLERQIGLVREL